MNMETNIVEILKDKPQGTKLYSSACGKCKLESVDDKSFKISFYNSKFGFMITSKVFHTKLETKLAAPDVMFVGLQALFLSVVIKVILARLM